MFVCSLLSLRAFTAHISKLRNEPTAYGALGLAELFEMREECLREFGFSDVYRYWLGSTTLTCHHYSMLMHCINCWQYTEFCCISVVIVSCKHDKE